MRWPRPGRGEAPRESGSADARSDRMQVRVPAAGRPKASTRRRPAPPQLPSDSRRRVRSLGRGGAGLSRVARSPGQHGSRTAEPRGRPTNPLGGAGAGARRAGKLRAWPRRPERTQAPSLGSDGVGRERRRAAAFAGCVCVVFSLDSSGLTPPPVSRRRARRKKKKDFY